MKSRIVLTASTVILISLISGCYLTPSTRTTTVTREYTQTESEYNADELNQYGRWISTPEYGRVWQPAVNQDWQPFYDGHWVYDGSNQVWVSNEPYGQIVYHYGNWVYTDYNGWVWIPTYDRWSPARVQWIHNGDMICWAPMPPRGGRIPEPWEKNNHVWSIVKTEDFYRENVGARRIRNIDSPNSFNRSQFERNAPDVRIIERKTNQTVPVTRIDRKPIKNNNITPRPSTDRNPVNNEIIKERTPDPRPAIIEKTPASGNSIREGAVERKPIVKERTQTVTPVEKQKIPEERRVVKEPVTPAVRNDGREITPAKESEPVKRKVRQNVNVKQKQTGSVEKKAEPENRVVKENEKTNARERAVERKAETKDKKVETPERER